MSIKLLFVDDDTELHPLFKHSFTKKMPGEKYELLMIDSAPKALEIIRSTPGIDIVLCDVNMPEMDGLTFLSEIKKIDPIIKVIMISASQDISNIRKAMNKDAFDFIIKPIDFEDLEATLTKTYDYIVNQREAKRALDHSMEMIQKTLEQTIQVISTIGELRDPYTAGHQLRVAQLANSIAKELNCTEEQCYWIYVAGLMHDIGKICIPTEILCRPGGVSLHELELIRDHADAGYQILKGIEFPWPVADIVHQHHERLNGTGYPLGLKAEGIRIEAKIISVADTVEAVSSFRPYRPAMGIEKGLEIINKEKGSLYDEEIVDACNRVIKDRGFNFEYNIRFSTIGLSDLKDELTKRSVRKKNVE